MPHLLNSICTIIGVFHKYAKWQGDCSTLNQKEMKKLILKEFSQVIRNPHDPETVELIFQKLDLNENGLVDFNEYLLLLFQFTKACYSHLQPRECLSEGGPQEEGRDCRHLDEDERVGVRERPDSGRTRHRPIEGTARGERRDFLPQSRERSSQAHDSERRDDRGRDCSFHDSEDEYEGRPRRSGTRADVETRPQTRRLEPERDQAGRHELRRREAAGEEDRQRQSQELVPRSNGGGRHPTYGSQPWGGEERERYAPEGPERQEGRRHSWAPGTEHRLDDENLTRKRPSEPRVDEESHRRHPRAPEETQHDGGRCYPSSGSQEWADRRRRDSSDEQEIQDKLSSRDPERRQDHTQNRKPVDGADECLSLPRVGERRRSHTHESEHRERSWPSEPDRQDGEWTGQRRGRTQYRGAEHGTDQPSGPEVRETEWRLPHGDHTRCPHPWEPRAEVEDRQRSRDPEGREQDRSRPRPRPYEPESTGSGRGWSQSYASESREGLSRRPRRHDDDDTRRQRFHLEEEVDRRRPWFPEPEPRDCGRPERPEREDSQGRHHYDGAEPQERESHGRRPQLRDPESREGQRRSAPQTGSRDDQRERPRAHDEDDRRRDHQAALCEEAGARWRPQTRGSEPSTLQYNRPGRGMQELRGDRRRRQQSPDGEDERGQQQQYDSDSSDGEQRTAHAQEPLVEDVPRSQPRYESKPVQREGERRALGRDPARREDNRTRLQQQQDDRPEEERDTQHRALHEREPARSGDSLRRPPSCKPSSLERASEWGTPQSCSAEPMGGERRQPRQTNLDRSEGASPTELLSRHQGQEGPRPSEAGSGGCDRNRRQAHESSSREPERRAPQPSDPKRRESGQSKKTHPGPGAAEKEASRRRHLLH